MKFYLPLAVALALCSCQDLKEEPLAPPSESLPSDPLINPVISAESSDSAVISDEPVNFDPIAQWWTKFESKELDKLIDDALKDSSDIKLMRNRVKLAEQELASADADKQIKRDLSVSSTYTQYEGSHDKSTQGGAALSWELDIWDKLSNLSQAALAEYKASEADWQATMMTVISDITSNYFQLRQLDELVGYNNEAMEISKTLEDYYKVRHEGGIESGEFYRAQAAEGLRLKSNIRELKRRRQLAQNQIAVLLGKTTSSFKLPPRSLHDTVKPIAMPTKLSANLLERRPDIIAADFRVRSIYSQKEAARAARLPEVTVDVLGSASDEGFSLDFTDWAASISPRIKFPALDPQTQINIEKARIELDSAQEKYRQTVIKAVAEVANVMTNMNDRTAQVFIEQERLKNLEISQNESQLRFDNGLITQLELLNYQQQVLAAKEDILGLETSLLNDTINLHNALGGTWIKELNK
jgi:NodT family efflux transporter outer membrane factor (OMF) lipoprotein